LNLQQNTPVGVPISPKFVEDIFSKDIFQQCPLDCANSISTCHIYHLSFSTNLHQSNYDAFGIGLHDQNAITDQSIQHIMLWN